MLKQNTIAINLKNLSVDFYQRRILNNIELTLTKNHITVLVGRSGSGKTTLLRSLNCLNQEYEGCRIKGYMQVDLGNGLVCVYDSDNKKSATNLMDLRRKVGMLFQSPQLLPVSIYRNIAMPMELSGSFTKKNVQEQVQKVLEMVGLWEEVKDRLNLNAEILSTGQQQRLCLARTLALEPKILLLDEPTCSLDIKATRQIEQLLEKLKKQYTIIMVSHSLKQARHLADDLILLDQGQVVNNYSQIDTPSLAVLENWFYHDK